MRLVQQKTFGLTTFLDENAVSPNKKLPTNNVTGRKRG